MARNPNPGSDRGTWGEVLNERLDELDGKALAADAAANGATSAAASAQGAADLAQVAADAAQADASQALTDAATVQSAVAAVAPAGGVRAVGKGELVVNVKDYGAVGDGVADDTAAINAAVSAAKAASGRVVGRGTFRTNATVVIDCNADLGDATFDYYGSGTAVEVGAAGSTLQRKIITVPRVVNKVKPTTGWPASGIGVDVINANTCTLTVPFVQGFTTGLRMYGAAGGTTYCNVTLGWLFNNKINLLFDSDATGWSTQNVFFGGRMSHHADEGTDVAGVVSVQTQGPGDGGPNNLTFLGTCLEGAQAQYTINMDKGRFNQFLNCRFEYANKIRFGSTANRNRITGGYGIDEITVIREAGETFNNIDGNTTTVVAGKTVKGFRNADPFDWWRFDPTTRRLYLGNGTADPVAYLTGGTGGVILNGLFQPATHNTRDIGTDAARWRDIYAGRYIRLGTLYLRDNAGTLEKSTDGTTWSAV